jgi:uncharacterized membrane protein
VTRDALIMTAIFSAVCVACVVAPLKVARILNYGRLTDETIRAAPHFRIMGYLGLALVAVSVIWSIFKLA